MEDKIMEETFGQRLSRIRKEKGMTQEDIAKRIVISPQAVSKWENDLSSPDILVLSSLADILGVTVDELLGRESETTSSSTAETVESEVVNDDEKFSEESSKEDSNKKEKNVHVTDDKVVVQDGDDKVVIDSDGVHLHSGDECRDICFDKCHRGPGKLFWITQGSLFGLALIGYILMGILWKDQNMGWSMGWILFLLPPVIMSIVSAINKRRFTDFLYPIFIVALYCTLGFLGGYLGFEGWGFYWFLFITIPAYYLIFGPIDAKIHQGEKDDDDDEDDD